jgi:hypothetical protein
MSNLISNSISLKVLIIGIIPAVLAIVLMAFSPNTEARAQRGYIKKNGTYVSPHYKSNPDGRRYNNKGSRSNGGKQRDEFSNSPAYNKSRNR